MVDTHSSEYLRWQGLVRRVTRKQRYLVYLDGQRVQAERELAEMNTEAAELAQRLGMAG